MPQVKMCIITVISALKGEANKSMPPGLIFTRSKHKKHHWKSFTPILCVKPPPLPGYPLKRQLPSRSGLGASRSPFSRGTAPPTPATPPPYPLHLIFENVYS
jgi:hypothetical protein